jgi:diguanylate cyclase (GGDEF)-like protein
LTFFGSFSELFLTLFYPIGDLILLGLVISLSLVQKKSGHNVFLALGLISFTTTDFYFLWMSASNNYHFASLTDCGWLLGFILISESFWYQGEEARENLRFNPLIATFALLVSASILVISALRPGILPALALLPALATILLAFIRMAIAINDAKAVSAERILARTDELTGLANRRKFIAELEKFRTRDSSVLLLDLNGFKSVNDRFGHDVGDDLLKRVALRFTRAMPANGVLARLGGDEFGVLVAGDGFELAQALRATLTYPFEIEGEPISLDVSIGEAANDGSDQVLRRADEAMYNAKRAGGGVVRWR